MSAPPERSRFKTVLLVDDSRFDNLVHERLIIRSGLCEHLEVYPNGKLAIDALADPNHENAHQLAETDLILLDINMPILDGFGFLKRFPELTPTLTQRVNVVILTSYINLEDKRRSSESPFVAGYINKPLTEDKLAELADL